MSGNVVTVNGVDYDGATLAGLATGDRAHRMLGERNGSQPARSACGVRLYATWRLDDHALANNEPCRRCFPPKETDL